MAEETMQGIQPAHQELGTLQEPSMFKDGFSTPEPLCVHSLSVVAFLFGKDVYVLWDTGISQGFGSCVFSF